MGLGQAVEFSVAPLGACCDPWDDSTELKLRLESKPLQPDGKWQHVSEELVTLKGTNVINRLDRAQFAYRVSLWPTSATTEWAVAFPFYLPIPALSPSSSDEFEFEMCPPNIGTFTIALRNEENFTSTEYPTREMIPSPEVAESRASQAAAVLGGTLAAAILLYSLLPYVKVVRRRRQRTRSHPQTAKEKEIACNAQESPKSPLGTAQRFSGQVDYGIEPAGAYRNGIREKKSGAPSDSGSELLLATLPDFNDERGWRDFFDSQIYHDEPEKKKVPKEAPTSPSIIQRRNSLNQDQVKIAKLRHAKSTMLADRDGKFQSIKERIDRAAMEAALDDAQNFFEFWQT